MRTEIGPGNEIDGYGFLLGEEAVVGAEPRTVLRVRARVVGEPAEANVPADCGQVSPGWVNDIVYSLRRMGLSARSR